MLWSLAKVVLFVLIIAAVALAIGQLSEAEEAIQIVVAGWEFRIGPEQALVLTCILIALVWILLKVLGLLAATFRFLNGDETAISRYFDRNRERKGYRAISEGLMALASGEPRLALTRALAADRLLGRPDLTTLLVAQAAEAAGDRKQATEAFKKLLGESSTRFVGLRGLLQQKLAEGEREVALKLAEKAFELRPKHAEVQDILLKLQSEAGDWSGARVTLSAKLRSGSLPKDVFRRRDAVLALQQARAVLDEDASIESREAAIEANRLSPDLVPAAALAARSYVAKGDKKAATRILKKAWEVLPHPDLAAAFAEIEPQELPHERLKRFRALTSARPDDDESRLIMAELNLAVADFASARRALGGIATERPSQRAFALLAGIARAEGESDAVVRDLVSKAIAAPKGPQWLCDSCQAIHSGWRPICENCGGFDTLSWRVPPAGSAQSADLAELLPLIEMRPVPIGGPSLPEADTVPPLDEIARRAN